MHDVFEWNLWFLLVINDGFELKLWFSSFILLLIELEFELINVLINYYICFFNEKISSNELKL